MSYKMSFPTVQNLPYFNVSSAFAQLSQKVEDLVVQTQQNTKDIQTLFQTPGGSVLCVVHELP